MKLERCLIRQRRIKGRLRNSYSFTMNKAVNTISMVLLIVGGLNWGLIGLNMDWNVVGMIFGSWGWLLNLVYILVGLSALYHLWLWLSKKAM